MQKLYELAENENIDVIERYLHNKSKFVLTKYIYIVDM